MANAAQIRNQIQSKIFAPYAKSVTLQSFGTTYDERSDVAVWTAASSSTISIVPYDINANKESYQMFGNHNIGDMYSAVPYTTTININDRLIIDGITWQVMETVPHLLPTNLVTVIRMSKVVA